MKLYVGSNYVITSDPAPCFTVNKVRRAGANAKEPGAEVLSAVSYCGDLESALRNVLQRTLADSDAETARTLADDIAAIKRMISESVGRTDVAVEAPEKQRSGAPGESVPQGMDRELWEALY